MRGTGFSALLVCALWLCLAQRTAARLATENVTLDFNPAFFKGKPTSRNLTSQHPYAEEFVRAPGVITVDVDDLKAVEKAVKGVVTSEVGSKRVRLVWRRRRPRKRRRRRRRLTGCAKLSGIIRLSALQT